jgi:hypothetical protein
MDFYKKVQKLENSKWPWLIRNAQTQCKMNRLNLTLVL